MSPANRLAVVTGAARGIGRVTVAHLVAAGWEVVAVDRDEPPDDRLGARWVQADVTDTAQVERFLADEVTPHGRLDALINNAALIVPRGTCDGDLAAFDDVVRTNTRAVLVPTRAATALLAAGERPAVVNLGSIGGQLAFRSSAAYVASKGAVAALTRALALDLAPSGVRVNAVAPGMVRTEAWTDVPPDEVSRRGALIPLGRAVDAEEVAAAIAFLAGTGASGITGQTLAVDGGHSVQAYTPLDEAPLHPAAPEERT